MASASALARALSSLRGACSTSGRGAALGAAPSRALSAAAADGDAAAAPAAPHADGIKTLLRRVLQAAEAPLPSAAVWEAAEPAGARSKRHVKAMLAQMRRSGEVRAVPLPGAGKKARSFGYLLRQGAAAEALLAAAEAQKA
jgi:hypothetical protein